VDGVNYKRERIVTSDEDFLDIDWHGAGNDKIALLIHGLEASADKPYMRGMAKALSTAGYKVAAMNLRGCSGETNYQPRAYHSGSTDDVETVINHILSRYELKELVLVGFSLGGNLVIKYLGEHKADLSYKLTRAVTISVPCDLEAGAIRLDKRLSFIYRDRFLKTLKSKLQQRSNNLPFSLRIDQIKAIRSLHDFDNLYTSRMHDFENAIHYYRSCGAKKFISDVTIPTLILTAKNDPFFTDACLPFEECENQPNVFLEVPEEGGHVGFCIDLMTGKYYSELRAVEFLTG
jgi:predicted alpha/beta-fold hydrolase